METMLLKELERGGLSAAADMFAAVVCSVDFLDVAVVVPGVVAALAPVAVEVATIGGGAAVGTILASSSLHSLQAKAGCSRDFCWGAAGAESELIKPTTD